MADRPVIAAAREILAEGPATGRQIVDRLERPGWSRDFIRSMLREAVFAGEFVLTPKIELAIPTNPDPI